MSLIAALLVSLGCKDPAGPPSDTPPSIFKFEASHTSAREGQTVSFSYGVNDDHSLALLVLDWKQGKADTLSRGGPSSSGTVTHSFTHDALTEGVVVVELRARDNAGQTAEKSLRLTIGPDRPPQLIIFQILGLEGTSVKTAVSSIIRDPEGDPFSLQMSSEHPAVSATLLADSIEVRAIDPEAYGTFDDAVRLTARDTLGRTVEYKVGVRILPRDDLWGYVHDILNGSIAASFKPELVMGGPFSGWVDVDGQRFALDAQGGFRTTKLPYQVHHFEVFLTNGRDSSLIASDSCAAGDRQKELYVNTNAGTGVPLRVLWEFYNQATFDNGPGIIPSLHGVNLRTRARENIFYLSGTDLAVAGDTARALTSQMQDVLASYLATEVYGYLNAQNQPAILKAAQAAPLPLRRQTPPTPNSGMCLTFQSAAADTVPGRILLFDEDGNSEYEAAVVRLAYDRGRFPETGFQKAAVMHEFLSWLCSQGEGVSMPSMGGRTCLHSATPTDYLTHADIKLLYMLVNYDPGTKRDLICKLTQ